VCPSFGWPHLWLLLLSSPLAVPDWSGFAAGASPFPQSGPSFGVLTEPVLSGRRCLSDRCSVADARSMRHVVASCQVKRGLSVGHHRRRTPSRGMSAFSPRLVPRVGSSRAVRTCLVVCAGGGCPLICAACGGVRAWPRPPVTFHEGKPGPPLLFRLSDSAKGMRASLKSRGGVLRGRPNTHRTRFQTPRGSVRPNRPDNSPVCA